AAAKGAPAGEDVGAASCQSSRKNCVVGRRGNNGARRTGCHGFFAPPIARVLNAETAAQMRCRFVEHCADCRADGLFLLRLARSRIWRVPTEAVVLVVAAEVRRVVAAAAHALDAEGLFVRLAADRQADLPRRARER